MMLPDPSSRQLALKKHQQRLKGLQKIADLIVDIKLSLDNFPTDTFGKALAHAFDASQDNSHEAKEILDSLQQQLDEAMNSAKALSEIHDRLKMDFEEWKVVHKELTGEEWQKHQKSRSAQIVDVPLIKALLNSLDKDSKAKREYESLKAVQDVIKQHSKDYPELLERAAWRANVERLAIQYNIRLGDAKTALLPRSNVNLKPSLEWDEALYHYLQAAPDLGTEEAKRIIKAFRPTDYPAIRSCLECGKSFEVAKNNPDTLRHPSCSARIRKRRQRARYRQ